MRVTIDTNLINVEGREPSMVIIERWQSEGRLVLVGANRLLHETAAYKPSALAKARVMPNLGEPLVYDVGFYDERQSSPRVVTEVATGRRACVRESLLGA